jgi:amino acid adenylation domain-containing protein
MTPFAIVHRLMDMPPDWHDRTALSASDGRISFADLRRGMLKFGGWLTGSMGVQRGDRVAVCLPKSLATAQMVYGIFAAGATYVPLQFHGPMSRLNAILASLAPRLLLTTPEMAGRLANDSGVSAAAGYRTVELSPAADDIDRLSNGIPSLPAVAESGLDELAAIFFTSGSTGNPKGVMWSRRAMATTIQRARLYHRVNENDVLISHAGLHYSPSIDMFFPLLCGCHAFLLADRETMLTGLVGEAIEREGVTMWVSSATLLRLLVESGNLEQRQLAGLRYVEFMGEPLAIPVLRRLMAALPGARFVNNYGATEAYDVAHYEVPRPLPDDLSAVPLGRPLGNYVVSLRDESGTEVPQGTAGEICVVGPQVTMGYWADPEQTARRRIDGRADSYRSGDFAYFGPDGILRLIGRQDHVVKLHGNRFDLSEIEAALKAHPAVREAVAVAIESTRTAGESEVRAAVQVDTSSLDADTLIRELRHLCRDRLPNFARPALFVPLADFPLLSTGKIDRGALKARLSAK